MTDTLRARPMPDDLTERLRAYEGRDWETTACYNGLRDEAADALDAARARIAELEATMTKIANLKSEMTWGEDYEVREALNRAEALAEAALAEGGER